ncbi:type II toxin-antitoxin system MqsA family antitoxin [Citrobacter portucalensis]|uniref:type II toxin-antitoxin system MqsA family antitoxin n=1 Tax=Citrobacter portucalensis TaxID=1639133 RepID=UPI00226B4287|nr:type II toxin-antitoxin system MqsA family antitoxin [Citrobacter portucalensis]MCX8985157.1 type II toxin-antitoxin system MqsA family antitoxin [Citrobacter portucalensis]
MKCPICGGAELVHETRDIEYEYKGRKTTISGVTGDFCDACGESILDDEAGDQYMAAITAFNREVNAEEVDPAFIAAVRKRLKLDQRQAAELFGGGANAFSRYETGRVSPPVALIKWFKLFDRDPEMLDQYRQL